MAASSSSSVVLAILLVLATCSVSATSPSPSAAMEPTHCTGCIDGQWTETCPKPQQCGYKPVLCVNCMNGHAMPKCPNIAWCGGVDCSANVTAQCIDGVPTVGCPDPGACGFKPIPCTGCVTGQSRADCPNPEFCYQNMTTPPCMNCMDGMAMPDCPDPEACKPKKPNPPADYCTNCIDGQPTSTCPKPQQCGYKPILCVDCMDGMAMPKCPNATWCTDVDCSKAANQCQNGVPTANCPDPGTCGFDPIPCSGCVPGQNRTGCPNPDLCYEGYNTPPCLNCMDGMSMQYCPDPDFCKSNQPQPDPPVEPKHCQECVDGEWRESCPKPQLCGYKPILCVDCMDGMAMPQCPNATWCAGIDCSHAGTECVDGIRTANCPDPGTCGYHPIPCIGCVPGLYRYACPHPEWCYSNMTTPPCMDCMVGMAMPYCPNATACMGKGPQPPPPPPPTPLQCDGCMIGMPMPGCPYPDLCPSDPCTMQMLFGASSETCLFLYSWHVTNGAQWFGAFAAILLLAILREGLSVWRVHKHLVTKQEDNLRRLQRSSSSSNISPSNDPSAMQLRQKPLLASPSATGGGYSPPGESRDVESPLSDSTKNFFNVPSEPESDLSLHFFDSFYYFWSLIFGYLLMLVIMSYNIWLCLMVVGSCFICHFLCNYLYHSIYKRRYLHRIRCKVQEWHLIHKQLNQSVRDSTGVIIDGPTKPASGDHCCDDIAFDDI